MKILHFLWALDNGGAENLAIDLANAQCQGNQVTLLVANSRMDPSVFARIAPAVLFICVGRPEGSRNPFWIFKLIYLIIRLRPDVIHSHAQDFAKLGRFISAKLILTVHDTHINLGKNVVIFSRICCISRAVLNDISKRYPNLKPQQVNNGVLTANISTLQRPSSQSVCGIQVSRLVHEKKGQDLLIKALALINAKPSQRKLFIDFVGDGPSLRFLSKLAADLGVSEYCNFLGAMSRDDIYQKLCKYDILIQPSRYEGFGLTVAEGMAARTTVIVSNIEGPMEIISDGVFGISFRKDDVSSLVKALEEAMACIDTDTEAKRLEAAHSHVIENYDLSKTASRYLSIYKEVINE